MRRFLFLARVALVWRLTLLGANMTDRTNVVAKLMQAILTSSTAFTITPGTGGGSAFTFTPPYFLRLMTANGSPINTANGTELAATGYTAGGNTMGATAFGAPSAGVSSNSNSVSWTAGAAWSAVVGIEIWDSSATKQRVVQGAITSVTLANGNTLTFAAASITADASQW